jgi:hypothetical protein
MFILTHCCFAPNPYDDKGLKQQFHLIEAHGCFMMKHSLGNLLQSHTGSNPICQIWLFTIPCIHRFLSKEENKLVELF